MAGAVEIGVTFGGPSGGSSFGQGVSNRIGPDLYPQSAVEDPAKLRPRYFRPTKTTDDVCFTQPEFGCVLRMCQVAPVVSASTFSEIKSILQV
ncbi:hypothetical protein P3T76_006485 [Phytophthora citrophthora]|uniref:Uncharacterized protein n=1 Tax=Phytophthora citrophthora TaxID=4793 RepID=A0AAD9GPU9_9STRA|nr:hypothetical protein P3T76_006485 [Phytophthora citrophthora]